MSREVVRKCALYKIVNRVNDKEYFGVSIEPQNRILAHLTGKGNNSHSALVRNAVKKYGIGAFDFSVILISNEDYCYQMEEKMVATCGSIYPNGYNLVEGGGKPPRHKKGYRVCSEQTKEKLRQANLGKKMPQWLKDQISQTTKGRPATRKDFTCKPETSKLLSEKVTASWAQRRINYGANGRKDKNNNIEELHMKVSTIES